MRKKSGFTLTELLIVIVVLGILAVAGATNYLIVLLIIILHFLHFKTEFFNSRILNMTARPLLN